MVEFEDDLKLAEYEASISKIISGILAINSGNP